ncbi:T9SS type A sorting domain-containing protein [Carboxylicivirga taeanensis]|uniref:T9SS type A sorting domain-containing protein n=1 Tax=Carboxylicivirga taeanensis TaxID=1416875 RepID=UPI003F6DD2B3
MKKFFTLLCVCGALFSTELSAQTDITPSRYKFNTLPTGPYSLDKQVSGSNPTPSDQDVKDHWNNGFIVIGNPNMATSLTFDGTGPGDILNSYFQVIDMGGEVGKVLLMKGSESTFPYGQAGKPGFSLGWWSMMLFTDINSTPAVADFLPDGISGSEATQEQLAEAEAQATVRMRVVFHIHQNAISTSSKLFDILGYTYTNNAKKDGANLDATREFKSGDFTDVVFNEETEEEEITYNADKWIACEYDFSAPEVAGTPLRFNLRMGGNAQSTALLIKEITFTANPTGAPVEFEELTLTSNPVATSIEPELEATKLQWHSTAGQLHLKNVTVNTALEVYSMTGQLMVAQNATQPEVSLALAKGIYIVRSGNQTTKVAVQ